MNKFKKKLTYLVIIFVAFYILYLSWDILIEKIPLLNSFYYFFYNNFIKKTIMGMLISSIVGSLFFVFLPIEVQFVHYASSNYNVFLIAGILLLGNVLGLSLDYFIGHTLGERLAENLFKKKYHKFKALIEKVGSFFILIGNMIFFPIEIFSVIVGASDYPYKKFLIYTIIGKVFKFALLLYIVIYLGMDVNSPIEVLKALL